MAKKSTDKTEAADGPLLPFTPPSISILLSDETQRLAYDTMARIEIARNLAILARIAPKVEVLLDSIAQSIAEAVET